jgi:nucleotide-binding universal stress UspA family protein
MTVQVAITSRNQSESGSDLRRNTQFIRIHAVFYFFDGKSEVAAGRQAGGENFVDYTRSHPVDLIVIATHGYSEMKRLMFGSLALQMLHDANVPVLASQAKAGRYKGRKAASAPLSIKTSRRTILPE